MFHSCEQCMRTEETGYKFTVKIRHHDLIINSEIKHTHKQRNKEQQHKTLQYQE